MTGFAYRPALDGLRAVSVAAVFAYHLDYVWAGGGFLGVDVFFVLSGYLISSLLLSEFSRKGRIDLRAFWARRARRLLPAIFLLLLVLALYAATLAPADQLDRLRGDALATLFYVQNWWLILQGQSYFDLYATPSPLRHAWSLAIEEQFYLLWPLIVFAALRGRGASRRPMLLVCLLGTAASVVWMYLCYDPVDPSRAYYGTGARAQVLLVGALLAVALEGREAALSRWRGLIGALGAVAFVVCLGCFAFVGDEAPFFYRGGSLLFSVMAAVVIAAAVAPGRSSLKWLLTLPPMQWLGWISYGVYLWHWPVIVVLTRSRVGLDGNALAAFQIAITVIISVTSYVLVERPVRYGMLRARLSPAHGIAAGASLAAIILATTTGGVAPPEYLRNPGAPEITTRGPDETSRPATASVSLPDRPRTRPPAAPSDLPVIGIVGDSVASSLHHGLADAVEPLGFQVLNAAVPGCGLAVDFAVRRDNGAPFPWSGDCRKNVDGRLNRLFARTKHPGLIVWLSSWDFADRQVDGRHVRFMTPEGDRLLEEAMEHLVRRFRKHGFLVAIVVPPGRAPSDRVPNPKPDSEGYLEHYQKMLRAFARQHPEDVALIDLATIMCPDGIPCPERIDGQVLRPDGAHFSRDGALWFGQRVLPPLLAGIASRGAPDVASQ